MEQTRALNALAPFLALSKSATSARAASDLVYQATSAANTYVFGELLQTPAIQSLRNDAQYANHYTLLELFAWGTWQEYQAASANLPSLNPVQQHKLRLLTLLTLAANTSASAPLTYPHLQSALDLESPLHLERLVTDAIYADLLQASLNPAQGTVAIRSVAPLRDLAPASVTRMAQYLSAWSNRCDDVLKDLETQMAELKEQAQNKANNQQLRHDQLRAAELSAEKGKKMDAPVDDDAMELDEGGLMRAAKKRGGMAMNSKKR